MSTSPDLRSDRWLARRLRPAPEEDNRRQTSRSVSLLRGLLPFALLIALWQIFGSDTSPFFPPPSMWWNAIVELWRDGDLLPGILDTVKVLVVSLVLASVLGFVIGLVLGVYVVVDRTLSPTVEFLRAMPPAAVVPIAALVIGENFTMTILVIVFASVWPILLATQSGVRHLNPLLLDVSRCLHLSRPETVRKVLFPALVPAALLGITVAAPMTLIVTLLVEILTRNGGIGTLIGNASDNFASAQVYGLVAVVGILALLLSMFVGLLRRWTARFQSAQ